MRPLSVALTLPVVALCAWGIQTYALSAAPPSGKAIAVIQSTDIVSAGAQRGLVPEAPVFMGDRIVTDTGGEAQIEFVDNTRLVVGPGSSLLIDKFVFRGETASNVTINAVRGTFRFITGNSPKNAYLIRTPTATLGLRGTRLDVTIGTRGETNVALFGEPNTIGIHVCDRRGRHCIDMKDRCDLVVVNPGGDIVRPQSAERAEILRTKFRYLSSQETLWSKFKVQPVGCGVTAAATFETPTGGWSPPAPAPEAPPPPVCGPGDGYGPGHGWGHGEGKFGGGEGFGKGFGGWGHKGGGGD